MAQRVDTLQFLRAWRMGVMGACAILAAAATGCSSTGTDELVPNPSATADNVSQPAAAQRGTASASALEAAATSPAEPRGPNNTGTYPNLNIPPKTANAQITDEEKAAETEALRATQERTASTAADLGKGVADPVVLRKLAAEHADEALKKIEAAQ
jgi:hypothetical protein